MESRKRRNLPSGSEPPSKTAKVSSKDIVKTLEKERADVAKSIIDFHFNKSRVKMLSKELEIPEKCDGIAYWMSRDQRVQDNWAFSFAQRLALKQELPLHVIFCLVPKFLDATFRHYDFLLKGLQEVETECLKLKIPFHLLLGQASDVLPEFVKKNNIGGVITDFSPLKVPLKWVKDVENALPAYVPFSQVDAHNIIPCWVTSDKQEYAARTIRPKIHAKLDEFLTNFPPVIVHPHSSTTKYKVVNWTKAYDILEVDKSVGPIEWAKPGYKGGIEMLQEFCSHRLGLFATKRNNPNENALSNLSPWLHFGQISAQRCILETKKYKKNFRASVEAYIEECVVRRELADNFCFYQKDYDNLKGAHDWAKKTIDIHRRDERTYIYSRKVFDEAKTHDDLWNAAQIQLVKEGKMHGFLRMYWAKKILEWTKSPEEALSIAIYLNDRYNLDGRDPNGYVGCMWSICGVHDTAWTERNIFGKIRFMNYNGCKRKFDIKAFISKYGGKEYKYNPKNNN